MNKALIIAPFIAICINAAEFNPQMQDYIDNLKTEAKKLDNSFIDFDTKRGEKIFTTSHIGKKGVEVSCVSCHTTNLRQSGKNNFTNKVIEPLSPNANKLRLTNIKDVQKWLKRNFNDVYIREGNAIEKGDVLYYINSK